MEIMFMGYIGNVVFRKYPNGRTALEFVLPSEGPLCKCTVNVPEVELEADEVIVKDYSECQGMKDVLVKAGIVEDTGKVAYFGHVSAPICRLLVKP